MRGMTAVQAYKKSASHRTIREREADIFLMVNATLRNANQGCKLSLAKAIADNDRLWITLLDVLADPANALPVETRAAIISVGRAVRREHEAASPDVAFLTAINQQIAAGLSGA